MEEIMTIKEVSKYLKMNVRTISKLATQGLIPATKIANQWRFMRSLINQWLEQQMLGLSAEQLELLESELIATPVKVTSFLTQQTIIADAKAAQKVELLKEMLEVGVKRKLIKNPALVLKALVKREALCSTAIGDEVAIPHPRQPLNGSFAKPAIIMARSLKGIEFDALDDLPVKFVFMLCLPDDYTHLKVLARLTRMLKDGPFRDALKSAAGAAEIHELIRRKDLQFSSGQAN